jgi:hypothetical protein
MISVSITIHEKIISEIDKKRGDIPRSKFISKLLERALNEDQITSIEKFLFDWKRGIKDVFRVTLKDIQGYLDKRDYEEHVIKPLLQKFDIDENDSELSEAIKYPGEY